MSALRPAQYIPRKNLVEERKILRVKIIAPNILKPD